jgi:hypothetical protein
MAVRFGKLRFLCVAATMRIFVLLWAPEPYDKFKVYSVSSARPACASCPLPPQLSHTAGPTSTLTHIRH